MVQNTKINYLLDEMSKLELEYEKLFYSKRYFVIRSKNMSILQNEKYINMLLGDIKIHKNQLQECREALPKLEKNVKENEKINVSKEDKKAYMSFILKQALNSISLNNCIELIVELEKEITSKTNKVFGLREKTKTLKSQLSKIPAEKYRKNLARVKTMIQDLYDEINEDKGIFERQNYYFADPCETCHNICDPSQICLLKFGIYNKQ